MHGRSNLQGLFHIGGEAHIPFHDVRRCSIDEMEATMNFAHDMRLRIASIVAAVAITAAAASQLVIWTVG
jgi:hypothetical protein